jgi:hypothetical protein
MMATFISVPLMSNDLSSPDKNQAASHFIESITVPGLTKLQATQKHSCSGAAIC